jgi:predicted DNA-binding transcriptional regulator YafY
MAQAKVDAALPAELRSRATRVRQRFHLDAPGWFDRAEAVPCLEPLSHAVWDERRVLLRYRRADRVVSRTVDPLGLVLKAGTWYVVGRAGRPATVRTYRVSRVTAVRVLPYGFERPDDFDLATAWTVVQETFARDLLRYEVRARVPADQLGRLRHALPAPAGEEATASAGPPDADGWCAVVIRSESEEVAHDELLRLGTHVRIVAPAALRTRVRETARAVLAAHE